MWHLPSLHRLPRASCIQRICCPAVERYKQNPWNIIPAHFLFGSPFTHPEETVASRGGNSLNSPCIFYPVCLFFYQTIWRWSHIPKCDRKLKLGFAEMERWPKAFESSSWAGTTGFPSAAVLVASSLYSLKAKNKNSFPVNPFFEAGRFVNAFFKEIHTLSIGVTKLMAILPYLKETWSLLWLKNSLKNPNSNNNGFDSHILVIQQYQFAASTAAYTGHGVREFPVSNLQKINRLKFRG